MDNPVNEQIAPSTALKNKSTVFSSADEVDPSENVNAPEIEKTTAVVVGLTKEELEYYRNESKYKILRWVLFILFWFTWIVFITAAVILIVLSPRSENVVNQNITNIFYENVTSTTVISLIDTSTSTNHSTADEFQTTTANEETTRGYSNDQTTHAPTTQPRKDAEPQNRRQRRQQYSVYRRPNRGDRGNARSYRGGARGNGCTGVYEVAEIEGYGKGNSETKQNELQDKAKQIDETNVGKSSHGAGNKYVEFEMKKE